jgi:phage tail sheath protein FI
MPVTSTFRTPGVYVTEEDAFPPSIVGVQTAVPAFIGYTEKAEVAGKPLFGKPKKIRSFADFVGVFGGPFQPDVKVENVASPTGPDDYDASYHNKVDGKTYYYKMHQTESSCFNLYGSMKLYFDNGGEECFVVSVGDYTDGGAAESGTTISSKKLTDGLTAVGEIVGPTMLLIPDAVLLQTDEPTEPYKCDKYYDLAKAMLAQCGDMQDRVAILDVYGANLLSQDDQQKFQAEYEKTIAQFRSKIGTRHLSYGMTYFPFLKTTVMSDSVITYEYFNIGDLQKALKKEAEAIYHGTENKPQRTYVERLIDDMDPKKTITEEAVLKLNGNLTNALPMLKQMQAQLGQKLGVLPASPAMAGVMAEVDATKGVWNAPANVSLNAVVGPTVDINNDLQGDLNVPLDGLAIDVIRSFPGRGTVPWGARTLLGNSNDWRYIQVRRTMIYIEQSIKNAMMPFVFAPNNGKTWSTVSSAISNFLQKTWSQGGLMGNTPDQAFTVECGLGSTMTAQDVLEGYMNVEVRVAMLRPAEFIVLNFKQKVLEG